MTTPPTLNIKKYVIASFVGQEDLRSAALKKAEEINTTFFKTSHKNQIYGFAKAVCHLNSDYSPKWKVVVQEINLGKGSKTFGESVSKTVPISLKPAFLELRKSIEEVIAALAEKRLLVIEPDELNRKLHKLLLYLLQASEWPYKGNGNNNPTIAEVQQFFIDYKQHIKDKNLNIQNQRAFYQFISQFKEHLQQEVKDLSRVTAKIVSKMNKTASQGDHLFKKVKALAKVGIERVLWPPQRQDEEIVYFCRVFSLYSFVYKPDVNNNLAREELTKALERLVQLLIAYDSKHQASTLFDFMKELMEEICNHFEGKPSLERSQVGPLTWVFQTLVQNRAFIEYIQTDERQQAAPTIADSVAKLFSDEETWPAAADLIISLGNHVAFERFLKAKVDLDNQTCRLTERQIVQLFLKLQTKYLSNGILREKSYKEMYHSFFRVLSSTNKLHFVRPFTRHAEYEEGLRTILSEKLDFSFMKDRAIPLETFFGNGTYLALRDPLISSKDVLKKTIVRLFSHYGQNPVNNHQQFHLILKSVLKDFDRGFGEFPEVVLGRLGELVTPSLERNRRRSLTPAEEWLQTTVEPIYQAIKTYVLLSMPQEWKPQTIVNKENWLGKICLHDGMLHVIEMDKAGSFVLKDLISGTLATSFPTEVFVAQSDEQVIETLRNHMTVREDKEAVARLTEAYLSFHDQENVQKVLRELLNVLFEKMQKEGNTVDFRQRVGILAEFLHSLAPFFKALDQIVQGRFFKDHFLKKNIALNLKAEGAKENHKIGERLTALQTQEGEPTPFSKELLQELSEVVSAICLKDIKETIEDTSLLTLSSITKQFESVVYRRVDELSYTKKEFIDSFCKHGGNKQQQLPAGVTLEAIFEKGLPIKEEVMEHYGTFLKALKPPINFILPNQALAIELCLTEPLSNKNLLLKLGTGQGKSLVIAPVAINEAKQVIAAEKDKTDKWGVVFVFTSYDHLADRDHAFAKHLFQKHEQEGIKSLYISTIDDVVKGFGSDVKIIYADVETIEAIVRGITLKLLKGEGVSQPEKEFLKTIYGRPNEELRVILDEFDLLIEDLKENPPFVEEIPTTLLDETFASKNDPWWSNVITQAKQSSQGGSKASIDGASGKRFNRVFYFDAQQKSFYLPPSVMRLSVLIRRAKRVIGLSGTALKGESKSFREPPLFFEIPSSQDPNIFGTKIQEGKEPINQETPHIACRKKIQFDKGKKLPDESYLIPQETIQKYCDAVIDDINVSRRENIHYQRPTLIFADPQFSYKTSENDKDPKPLWKTLKSVLESRVGSNLHFIDPQKNESTKEIEKNLERVARAGAATQGTIKYGRGADIRVHSEIDEGLHVTVGLSVKHINLLHQIIGRTGRMCRKGSYSLITFGDPILPQKSSDESDKENAFFELLHELTKQFITDKLLLANANPDHCKKWLMFLGRCLSERKIDKGSAKALLGQAFVDQKASEKPVFF